MPKQAPGRVRDAIIEALRARGGAATVPEIVDGVGEQLGSVVPSSVRSYLRLKTGSLFERRDRGMYELLGTGLVTPLFAMDARTEPDEVPSGAFCFGRQTLYFDDCTRWLAEAPPNSVHAVVTDPPYGLIEYTPIQQRKMREGRGGVWRIPPSFDGYLRKPLPRFTVLDAAERGAIVTFFMRWGRALLPVIRPGGHVVVAGNPLVAPLVSYAMEAAGFERRAEIVRLVRTFRGGDRPKGAHSEFAGVSTMPRSCWEPWGVYRKPLAEPTLAGNLRKWGTGGLRRLSEDTPFLDVIQSGKTPARERQVAPHPSVKPQAFLRQVVRAVLPVDDGVILDTFAGCATTLAACEALGFEGVGVEIDHRYWKMAQVAIPKLAAIRV